MSVNWPEGQNLRFHSHFTAAKLMTTAQFLPSLLILSQPMLPQWAGAQRLVAMACSASQVEWLKESNSPSFNHHHCCLKEQMRWGWLLATN